MELAIYGGFGVDCIRQKTLTFALFNKNDYLHTHLLATPHSNQCYISTLLFYMRMTNRNVNTELCIIKLKVTYQKENNTYIIRQMERAQT